jgi:Domain of unknown function (DUF4381)
MILSFLLTLALAAPPAAPAGRATITTHSAAPARLTVGDRFDVSYVVTSPHPSFVTGPLADSLGVFVVVGEHRHTARRGDHDELTYRMTAAGFKTGGQTLPALRFLASSGDRVDTLTSDSVRVTIASVLPADMKDIHGLKPPETFPDIWLYLVPAIALLLVALAWLGRRLLQRMRRLADQGPPPLPPWEEALVALDELPWREWLEAGQVKRYYYALSEILKRYLERRFEFDAVEQTTTELLQSMRAQRLPMRDEIGRFFAGCDLVKYAKSIPPESESERAIEQLRAFVVKTKPEPPSTAAASATPASATSGAGGGR